MKSLKYLTIFISIVNVFTVPSISQAQTNQTLGQCIEDVRRSSNYGINSRDAAQSCVNTLQYQPPRENLGQCIEGVRKASNYGINSQNANQLCQSLLELQLRNNRDSNQPTPARYSYALLCIENRTNRDIVFNYRWGNGQWTKYTLKPNDLNWFSWKYSDGSQSSPDFNIEFDYSYNRGYHAKSYILDRSRTNSQDYSAIKVRHHFRRVDSNNIDLYKN